MNIHIALGRAALAAALSFPAAQAWAQELVGVPRVQDGDSLILNGERLRLYGLDAPEHDQTCADSAGQLYACGTVATDVLRDLIGSGPVTCTGHGLDVYGRVLATSVSSGGVDINRYLARGGFVIAYLHFSNVYAAEQNAARAEHRGIWAGSLEQLRSQHFPGVDWRLPVEAAEHVAQTVSSSRQMPLSAASTPTVSRSRAARNLAVPRRHARLPAARDAGTT